MVAKNFNEKPASILAITKITCQSKLLFCNMIMNRIDLSTRRNKGFCEGNTGRACPWSNYLNR